MSNLSANLKSKSKIDDLLEDEKKKKVIKGISQLAQK